MSAIVYQVVQSALIDISQSVALWNIQAPVAIELQSYNVTHVLSGITGVFLIGRIKQQLERSCTSVLAMSFVVHLLSLIVYERYQYPGCVSGVLDR